VEDHAAVGPNTEKSWLALAVQSKNLKNTCLPHDFAGKGMLNVLGGVLPN